MELFTIGNVSKMCDIPIKTLRYYDEIGLLRPERISEENQYRYYSQKCIMQIALIKYFKSIGFTLEQIKKIIYRTDNRELEKYMEELLEGLREELVNVKRRISAVKEWNKLLEVGRINFEKRSLPIEVGITEMPQFKVLRLGYSFNKVNDFTEIIYRISNEFTNFCGKQDFLTFGSFLAYYPDSEQRVNENLSGAVFYSELVANTRTIYATERIGNKKAVKAIHIGSYLQIKDTYQVMFEWARNNEIELQKESYERYMIDPWSSYSEDNYVTEIIIPIKI